MTASNAPCWWILYVEDNPGDVFLVRTAMEEFGQRVTFSIARDCAGALRLFSNLASATRAALPDLVLLDLTLPGLSGFDLLQRMHDEGHPQIPVAILTAGALRSPGDRERCLALGAVAYFEKPADYPGYVKLVREFDSLMTATAA